LLRGRVVVVNKGQYEPLTDVDDKELTLLDFVELYMQDYETVFILDIDGIERRRPQLPLIQTITSEKNVWWDPGVRDLEDMMDTFTAGANRVVVGTKTIISWDDLLNCQEFSRDFVLGLDWAERILCRDASIAQSDPLDFLERTYDAGIRRVLFTQLGQVSKGSRISHDFVHQMVDRTRRLYIGGSGFDLTMAERLRRATLGVHGAVVGIYDIIREDIVHEGSDYDEGGVLMDRL
jgi:uncharacterized protein related to proFAR isomerase